MGSKFPFMELPPSIIEMILARVPPEDLHNKCKFVCREWKDIISGSDFARKNFLRTKYSQKLLMDRSHTRLLPTTKLLQIPSSESEAEYCKIRNTELWKSGRVISSCNGLIVMYDLKKTADGTLQVINLVTRACVTIPAPLSGCRHYYRPDGHRGLRYMICSVGIVYDPVSATYKVVHLSDFGLGFEVFTLNSCPEKETWRTVPGPWSDDCHGNYVTAVLDYCATPTRTGPTIHWSNGSENHIVSINVSDERNPFRTDFPVKIFENALDDDTGVCRFSMVDVDGDLGFLHNVSSSLIDVYILNHQRVWSKKHSILRQSVSAPKVCQLVAVCSLRDGQELVLEPLGHSRCLYVYDLRRRVFKKLRMNNTKGGPCAYVPHTSSLLHWAHT